MASEYGYSVNIMVYADSIPVRALLVDASIVLGFVRLIEKERLIEQILFGMFVHQEISESHGQ